MFVLLSHFTDVNRKTFVEQSIPVVATRFVAHEIQNESKFKIPPVTNIISLADMLAYVHLDPILNTPALHSIYEGVNVIFNSIKININRIYMKF